MRFRPHRSQGRQIRYEIGPLPRVGHAGIRHRVAGDERLRIGEVGIELGACPNQPRALHGSAVAESRRRGGFAADNAAQPRPLFIGLAKIMADRACREEFFALGGVLRSRDPDRGKENGERGQDSPLHNQPGLAKYRIKSSPNLSASAATGAVGW